MFSPFSLICIKREGVGDERFGRKNLRILYTKFILMKKLGSFFKVF